MFRLNWFPDDSQPTHGIYIKWQQPCRGKCSNLSYQTRSSFSRWKPLRPALLRPPLFHPRAAFPNVPTADTVRWHVDCTIQLFGSRSRLLFGLAFRRLSCFLNSPDEIIWHACVRGCWPSSSSYCRYRYRANNANCPWKGSVPLSVNGPVTSPIASPGLTATRDWTWLPAIYRLNRRPHQKSILTNFSALQSNVKIVQYADEVFEK